MTTTQSMQCPSDFIERVGPLSERERYALTPMLVAHPKPLPMLRILREPSSVKEAVYLGLEELRLRGWVRVRGSCWSMTTRGVVEAPSSPSVALLRRVMSGGQS